MLVAIVRKGHIVTQGANRILGTPRLRCGLALFSEEAGEDLIFRF